MLVYLGCGGGRPCWVLCCHQGGPSGLGLGSRRDGVRGHRWFCFSRQVCAPSGTRLFFQVAQTRIRDVFKRSVAKEFAQGLVIDCNDQVTAAEHEVASFVQGVCHSQCLSLNGRYLDSAGWVKRDPTSVTFHPSTQGC